MSIGHFVNYLTIIGALTVSLGKGKMNPVLWGIKSACSSVDRVSASGAEGLAFESPQARHKTFESRGQPGFFYSPLRKEGLAMRFETTILQVLSQDEKKKIYSLLVPEGEFHPSGGGQPGDWGALRGDGFLFSVQDVEKGEGAIVLLGKADKGRPYPGMEVEGEVDMERRFTLSRMHSGEHILSKALEKKNPGLRIFKVAVDSPETSVYLKWDGELTWDVLFEAEKEGNRIVAEDRPVKTLLLSREEAEALPDIKGNWDRIADDTIRVVKIEGFDTIACSGTHVSSTAEVGNLFITGFKGTAPEWEFKFSVEGTALRQEYSEVARRLVRDIGCKLPQLEQVYHGLQEEMETLKKQLERASQHINLPVKEERVGPFTVAAALLPGFTKDLAAPAARRWSDGRPKGVLIVLLPERDGEGGSFLVYRGRDVPVNFSTLLRSNPSLRAKGGGREDYLGGYSSEMSEEPWVGAVREFMEKERP